MSDSDLAVTFEAPECEEVAALFPLFDIHSLIACGGMGAVYQATQRSLDRNVAIKILPREFSTDEEFRKGFESEAKAMGKLNHPNLIGVYDFGEVDGMLFIIMEYVAGKSLFHAVQGSPVEQQDALRIVIETCHGLAHAHEHGILHRDIKPGNILLDANARPKIGDFGLARALESEIEEGEQIFGTPGYTAPEVLEPPYSFDQRADLFSVGVMLHEMLTGKLPDADPRPPSQQSGCNPRLDKVVKKATHRDPNARYGSATEIATILEQIANTPGVALATGGPASGEGNPYVPPKYKAKRGSGGLVFLVLLLVAGAAGAYFFLNEKPSAESETTVDVVEGSEGEAPLQEPVSVESELEEFNPTKFLAATRNEAAAGITALKETREKDLAANLNSFEIRLESLFRDLELSERQTLRSRLREVAAGWKADGNQIPAELPAEIAAISGAGELHGEYLKKQGVIENRLAEGIVGQSHDFVRKVEERISQLGKEGDSASTGVMQEEIRKIGSDTAYFSSLFPD